MTQRALLIVSFIKNRESVIEMKDEIIESIITDLQDEGYRINIRTRKNLLSILYDNKNKHCNISEIVKELRLVKNKVNISTIYNNLNLFVERGIVKENKFINSSSIHYETRTDLHAHLVCLDLENIADIDSINLEKIKRKIEKKYSFEISDISFNIYGRCRGCFKD
jgi:Fur family ferric uptake transcriptional regulator